MRETNPHSMGGLRAAPFHGLRGVFVAVLTIALLGAGGTAVWRLFIHDKEPAQPLHAHSGASGNSREIAADEPHSPLAVGVHGSFVASQACRKCHEEEYQSWHASYHRTMTQFATPHAIVAPLDGQRLEARGRTYRFERRGDAFYVTMAQPEHELELRKNGADLSLIENVPLTTRELVITTGSHHMQTFWIRSQDGLRQVPWYWHIAAKSWIPAEDSFLQPPSRERSFTRWNDACIKCHAVGEIPGLDPRTGFNTKVAELGIACEACHGQGRRHIEHHEQRSLSTADALAGETAPDETITNPIRQSHVIASQICAQCHSSSRPRDLGEWLAGGMKYQPGDNLSHHFHVVQFGKSHSQDQFYLRDDYWADGTGRTAGDEYQGLMESACHQRGELSCLSCHSLHQYAARDDQLKRGKEGNAACLQCHSDYESRLVEHTHHAAGSSGSLCYNCHMPHITYGLLKGIRSHRIGSPSAVITAKTGRPNACNLCHLDRTLAWTSERLTEWYGQQPADLTDDDHRVAASVRWLLAGDAVQRVIAAWHMGWPEARDASGNDWQGALLAHTLDDPYSVIRFVGHRSLTTLPDFEQFEFDFVGPPDGRKAAVERALATWRRGKLAPQPRSSVLLGDLGQLLEAEVERLRQSRDNRPITIHE